jgi:NADH-quinone oxidoreductase subunit M
MSFSSHWTAFFSSPLLWLLLLPVLGSLGVALLRGSEEEIAQRARWSALIITLLTFGLACFIGGMFEPIAEGFQLTQSYPWISYPFPMYFSLGIDGFSLPFLLLTAFTFPFCILASWHGIQTSVKEYMALFLILEAAILGVFLATDLLLFYVLFETCLLPMFLIIGVWGGKNRIYAMFKFFLYTLVGSILMLLAIIAIIRHTGTTDIAQLLKTSFPLGLQKWLWLGFFASFAVKMPMWPLHTWLPDAHVEAPTAGSVVLAALLLKLGGYGFLRFSLPMFPEASIYFAPFVIGLSLIAIIYTSLVALAQEDIKKLIAYSSVAHMGFVTLGLFSFTKEGIQGAIFQMISHGFISGALFLIVGILYERTHTRTIADYGGIAHRMPLCATAFMIFTLGNLALPGTSGFIGEILTILGTNMYAAIIAATGAFLSAAYSLNLYRNVFYRGENPHGPVLAMPLLPDLSLRETCILLPFVCAVLYYGLHPSSLLEMTKAAVLYLLRAFPVS